MSLTKIKELLKTDDAKALTSLLNGLKFEPLVKEFTADSARLNSPHACAVHHAAKDCLEVLLTAFPEGAQLKNCEGSLPHHLAVRNKECLALLLKAYPAGAKAVNNNGELPHHRAAFPGGSQACMEMLLQAYPEGAQAKSNTGAARTPPEIALKFGSPMVYALLDPEGAAAQGEKLKKEFEEARIVNVISTRFRALEEHTGGAQDPFVASLMTKKSLEKDEGVKTFNPNYDNAFLMKGHSEHANGIWLRNFRWAMTLAQKTGGRMVQVVVEPGLSEMQHAEADMAADKGIPVVRVDMRLGVEAGFATNKELRKMAQGELTAEQKVKEEALRLAREKLVEDKKAFLALEGAAINLDYSEV